MKTYIIIKIYNTLIDLTNWLENLLADMDKWDITCPKCHKNKTKLWMRICDKCSVPKFEDLDSCHGCDKECECDFEEEYDKILAKQENPDECDCWECCKKDKK